jgi:hypothetical protein
MFFPRRLAALVTVVAAITLTTGCSAAPPAPSAKADVSSTPAPVEVEQEPSYTPLTFDDTAVIYYPGTKDIAASMKISSVTRDVECPHPWAPPITLGEMIALNMTITTDEDYQTITANEHLQLLEDVYFTAADDEVQKAIAGFGCAGEGEEIPPAVPAGGTFTYPHFIDVSPDVTSVVWEPSQFIFEDISGWEWQLE